MHILLLLLLLALILIPLGYYVIAPSYIQYRIDTLDPSTLSMDTLVVRDFSNNTVAFDIKATLPPLLFLPLSAGFGPCTFTLYDSADAPLAHLNVPRIDFVLNEDLKLDFSGNLDLNSVNVQAIQSHVRGFSSKEGLKNVRIDGRSAVPLHALGIQWYSGLSLHKVLPLGDLKSDLGVLMEKIPSFMKSTDLPSKWLYHACLNCRSLT